ncbi:MAG: hypothetical protein IJF74_07430 [Clostridia bacterium]|nr:hypothetical protein [Clostridia bacterium]
MQIKERSSAALAAELGLEIINEADGERLVNCGYAGDLLSWVMGRAPADCAWVTVMSNVNVVAVASLADVGCVILAENAELDDAALEKARAVGINIYRTAMPVFEVCAKLAN